jgi:hypothetical protein
MIFSFHVSAKIYFMPGRIDKYYTDMMMQKEGIEGLKAIGIMSKREDKWNG